MSPSADGSLVLSGSTDNSMRLWRTTLNPREFIQWTQDNRYLRDLTCEERDIYGVEQPWATVSQSATPSS